VPPVLGLLYDVHGNLPALEAVLEDCPAERFVLGGDYAVAGAWPRETVERLERLDAEWIRGNTERWLADRSDAPGPVVPVLERCVELLGGELVDELVALPETTTRGEVLYCHASPGSDMQSFLPEPRDEDAELLLGVEVERVVFGHTHLSFEREGPGAIGLLNPGSVGLPWDGDRRAAYALVHDDGRIERRRVGYDWQAAADAVRRVYGEAGELPARRLEQARFDPV
jgi:diadenosine tetraphosphatase ApaH/serine/threonine PP2A family protein phosphatase